MIRLSRLWYLLSILAASLSILLVGSGCSRVYIGLKGEPPSCPYETPIPNTDVNPYGANFFLEQEVEEWKQRKTLLMAWEAGLRWARQQFLWAEIEPQRKGEFVWEKYDHLVDLYEEYGFQIIARLDWPPNWSRRDNSLPNAPPDDLRDYADFVYAFVDHYRGRINYVEIWNEPNIWPEWGNRPVDPEGYGEMLRMAYLRAKEADPDVYILSAPLAITFGQEHPEPGKWISMNELQFLEEMYEAGAGEYFDILSANAFGLGSPPEEPPREDLLNFSRVLLLREIMERYGDCNKAIWFSEYGWNAAPADFPPERLIWRRVSEEEQAAYTVRGIEFARAHWPWAGVFNIWYFRQVGNIPAERADYYFRMVDVDFTARPLYKAVQSAASGSKTGR